MQHVEVKHLAGRCSQTLIVWLLRVKPPRHTRSFMLTFACSPAQAPPTIQRHACRVN